jgi:hypothetical protein
MAISYEHRTGVIKSALYAGVCAALLGAALPSVSAAADIAHDKQTFHVEEATIAQIQSAILSRQITVTELVKLYLARIKAYNGVAVDEPQGILARSSRWRMPRGSMRWARSTSDRRRASSGDSTTARLAA